MRNCEQYSAYLYEQMSPAKTINWAGRRMETVGVRLMETRC